MDWNLAVSQSRVSSANELTHSRHCLASKSFSLNMCSLVSCERLKWTLQHLCGFFICRFALCDILLNKSQPLDSDFCLLNLFPLLSFTWAASAVSLKMLPNRTPCLSENSSNLHLSLSRFTTQHGSFIISEGFRFCCTGFY